MEISLENLAQYCGTNTRNAQSRLREAGLEVPEIITGQQDRTAYEALIMPGGVDIGNRGALRGLPMVGADPEFELLSATGQLVPANHYITDDRGSNQLGLDGHCETGEMRPSPGSGLFCAASVSRIMKDLRTHIPADITARAGGGRYLSLGGHIHVSRREASLDVADFLEAFIGDPLKAAQSPNSIRHEQAEYGEAYGFRPQPHGWEYRTPPSWLCSPQHTRGVLILSYLAATLTDADLRACLKNRGNIFEHVTIERPLLEEYFTILEGGKILESLPMFSMWGLEDCELVGNKFTLVIEDSPHLDFLRADLEGLQISQELTIKVAGSLTTGDGTTLDVPQQLYQAAARLGNWPAMIGHSNYEDALTFTPQLILYCRTDPGICEELVRNLKLLLGVSFV